MVAVSYADRGRPSTRRSRGLTFGTATADDRRKTRGQLGLARRAGLRRGAGAIIGAYVYFTG